MATRAIYQKILVTKFAKLLSVSAPSHSLTLSLSLSLSLSLHHHVARPNALHSISQVVASVDDVLPVSGNDNEYTHIAHTPASPSLIAMFVVCLSICI